LGVKNRAELIECIEAEEKGQLEKEMLSKMDNLFESVK
jgi:hypothetical protein